jgi:hypothetical protein
MACGVRYDIAAVKSLAFFFMIRERCLWTPFVSSPNLNAVNII